MARTRKRKTRRTNKRRWKNAIKVLGGIFKITETLAAVISILDGWDNWKWGAF